MASGVTPCGGPRIWRGALVHGRREPSRARPAAARLVPGLEPHPGERQPHPAHDTPGISRGASSTKNSTATAVTTNKVIVEYALKAPSSHRSRSSRRHVGCSGE